MRKYFITGLILLLPLALTIAIVTFVVNILTNPFVGVVENLLRSLDIEGRNFFFISGQHVLRYGSQILILVSLFAFTMLLGVLTRWYFLHQILNLSDYVIHHIPFVNKLYKTSQDIINTLFSSGTESFKQVVMVPFPTPKVFCIGFVTRKSPPVCSDAMNATLISIYIPTTPNPTSGYLLMFPKEDVHYLDMKVEDAIKFIISCGVIYPGAPEIKKFIIEPSKSNE